MAKSKILSSESELQMSTESAGFSTEGDAHVPVQQDAKTEMGEDHLSKYTQNEIRKYSSK